MAFDPSILSQIPDYGPNPVQAQSNALTLGSAGIDYQQKKQAQMDEQQARTLLKGVDLMTPEGQAKLQQLPPELRMKMMQSVANLGSAQREKTLQELQVADAQVDAIAGAIDPIVAQLDQLAQDKHNTPAMLDAKTKQLALPAALKLRQQRPDLTQTIDRFLQDPNYLTYQGLKSLDQQSKRGSQAIKDRIAQKQAETAAAREAAYERDITSKGQERERKATAAQSALLGPEDLKLAAEQYLAGDKSVFSGLGRGTQGAQNIVALRKSVREEAQRRGMTGGDIAAKMAEFNAIMAEERKIGGISGAVEFANSELQKFDPLVRQASADLPRGNFMPFTRMLQVGEKNLSDPKLRKLYVQITGFLNAYDVLAARGGTDKEKREHNREMLTTADSPEVLATALDAIKQELGAAREAGVEAKKTVAAELSDKPPSTSEAKTITSDAEYNALPSGTVFVGPDGQQRRKP